MAFLKCKMCGGDIELSADRTIGTCDHCGSTMTFPKVDDDQRAQRFNRGNQLRRSGEFDKALAAYEQIVQEDNTDAEAHWCCALCRFGIEYVEDPNTLEYIPTCHRASFESFLKDVDYLAAVEYSDGVTKRQYQKEAYRIAEVQRGILATSQNEEPFDVFICYKESEEDGTRTRDSLLAQEIYYQLTELGRRVFFSRITLEDKAGTEYEPYIFAALNSAKVMVLVTTSAEHANAVWVKNEWSRFLSLMRKDRHKLLLPCYRDMDPYDLPEALSVLQSYDMSRIGFIQDLIRGVNKVLDASKSVEKPKETVIVQQTASRTSAPLLRRAFMFLEDGDWERADEFCEQVLNQEPENAEAYLGKLMAELHIRTREALKDQPKTFEDRNNYQKAMRFGDEKLKAELTKVTEQIKERNRIEQLTNTYNSAVGSMRNAKGRNDFATAAQLFRSIKGFKDAESLEQQCREQIDLIQKEETYTQALRAMQQKRYKEAETIFDSILEYKDAEEQKAKCLEAEETERKDKIYREALAAMNQESYLKAEKAFETILGYKDARIKKNECAEKAEAERKEKIYQEALQLAKSRTIDGQMKAIEKFESIQGWKDSSSRITTARQKVANLQSRAEREKQHAVRKAEEEKVQQDSNKKKHNRLLAFAVSGVALLGGLVALFVMVIWPNMQYSKAIKLHENGQYQEAIAILESLNGYKDSKELIPVVQKDQQYADALALYNENQFEEAIIAFEALGEYRDSMAQIELCKTAIKDRDYNTAISMMNKGDYIQAYEALIAMEGYKDSESKAKSIYEQYKQEKLKAAKAGDYIIFGQYEQDNDTSNGKEDIEWLVLDKEGDRLLVISKYALECKQYHSSRKSITWEKCSLRSWLNGTFLKNAFSAGEQKMILTVTVTADKNPLYSTNPGNNSTDKVFLLSIKEVNQYFKSDSARLCEPTQYARSKGAYVANNGSCWWWLRSPGIYGYFAAYVLTDGAVSDYGRIVNYDNPAVRPALWIDLESLSLERTEQDNKETNTDENEEKYNAAISMLNAGDIVSAYETLITLDGYKDSVDQANAIYEQYKQEKLKVAKAGDYIIFGQYEQDNDTSNGKEDIEWLVLDKEGDRLLVISKYALDCKPYHSSYMSTTWEKCSLRSWLNSTFLKNAFSNDEQKKIPKVTVIADKNPYESTNPGNNTTDLVFLLSIVEADKYLQSNTALQCKPTAYAMANNAAKSREGNCRWWLRSPGNKVIYAAYVHTAGTVDIDGYIVTSVNIAVRPALWIDLGS